MLTTIFSLALLDGQIAEVFNSPFVVPVAGCAMTGSIVVAGIWSGVRTREIKSQERLARIAHGLPIEPDWDEATARQAATSGSPAAKSLAYAQPSDGSKPRVAGLILCAIGIGLVAFFAFLAIVLNEREVFSGACAGILPLAIGIGFLVDAAHRRRDYSRWMETVRPSFQPEGMPMTPPPPPTPPSMSPAQASDWRPLH